MAMYFSPISKLNIQSLSTSSSKSLLAYSNKIVAGTMTCNENSSVNVDDLVIIDQLIMEPKSTLTANTITMNDKPIIVNYEMGNFPEIRTKAKQGMTRTSKSVVQ